MAKSKAWCSQLKFVQMDKNSRVHSVLGCSPYEALFGRPVRRGLQAINLPEEIATTIRTEEQLQGLASNENLENGAEDGDDDGDGDPVFNNKDLIWTPEDVGIEEEAEEEQEEADDQEETLMDISTSVPLQRSGSPDLCKSCGLPAQPHESLPCQQCKNPVHWNCGFPTRGRDEVDDLLCNLCYNQAQIIKNREKAHAGQVAAGEKMKERTNGILDVLNVGDCVLVPVPDVDRGPTDPANIMGVVLEEKNAVYLVGTEAGVIKVKCSNRISMLLVSSFLLIN